MLIVRINFIYLRFRIATSQARVYATGVKVRFPVLALLCGSTGSGKSTMVDLLIGLLEPNSGKVLVHNIDINSKHEPKNF